MDCGQVRQWFYNPKTRTLTYGLREEDGGKCLSVGSKNNIFTAQVHKPIDPVFPSLMRCQTK